MAPILSSDPSGLEVGARAGPAAGPAPCRAPGSAAALRSSRAWTPQGSVRLARPCAWCEGAPQTALPAPPTLAPPACLCRSRRRCSWRRCRACWRVSCATSGPAWRRCRCWRSPSARCPSAAGRRTVDRRSRSASRPRTARVRGAAGPAPALGPHPGLSRCCTHQHQHHHHPRQRSARHTCLPHTGCEQMPALRAQVVPAPPRRATQARCTIASCSSCTPSSPARRSQRRSACCWRRASRPSLWWTSGAACWTCTPGGAGGGLLACELLGEGGGQQQGCAPSNVPQALLAKVCRAGASAALQRRANPATHSSGLASTCIACPLLEGRALCAERRSCPPPIPNPCCPAQGGHHQIGQEQRVQPAAVGGRHSGPGAGAGGAGARGLVGGRCAAPQRPAAPRSACVRTCWKGR
jgi:hypothetical protein